LQHLHNPILLDEVELAEHFKFVDAAENVFITGVLDDYDTLAKSVN
jgi:hypothetical protein